LSKPVGAWWEAQATIFQTITRSSASSSGSALHPSDAALQPIRAASKDNSITGHSNLCAITGNYRFEWQWRKLGAYFIGGGGWYYRTLGFTGPVSSGTGTECVPAWIYWGFACNNGTVTANQSRGSYTSSVPGGNVGAGLTIKVGEPSYRIYIEPRYHYAPTQNAFVGDNARNPVLN
jgi:hypothetical protein